MRSSMNRKEWLKSSGVLFTGGISMTSLGFVPRLRTKFEINRDLRSSQKFVSDLEFQQTLPDDQSIIRLMANENPFGPSDKAKEALIKAVDISYQYAFKELEDFATRIAEEENVDIKNVLITSGSTDVLTAGAIYYTNLGGNMVAGDPSYADMPSFAESMGAEVRWVKLNDEYKLDLKAMEAAVDENTKCVYIVNPNNPTATILDTKELTEFCKRVSKKATIFVDEAYIEYLDDPDGSSMANLVSEGYDIIIARTFSKLYGFAGLRIGYAVSSEENIKMVEENSRGYMGVSTLSISAALAAYKDFDFLNEAKTKTIESKEFLYKTLEDEGYEYIPSSTNFVMFPINMPGRRFEDEIIKRGIAVRSWEFDDKDWCRISIGTMPQMEAFAKAFKQIS